MRRFKWLSVIVISFFILSCGKSLPELKGVDLKAWKDDSNGCQHKRSQMTDAIKKEKSKLLALDELQIIKLLGRPDRNELFKRNQKFFFYFLEPSDRCSEHDASPLKLSVRFNAMGLAKEVTIE